MPGTRPNTRHPAIELLMVNDAVAARRCVGKTHQLATRSQTGHDDGMITFEASLIELLRVGRITHETVLGVAHDATELQCRSRDARL